MANQPRYDPLEASDFFADGMSARPRIEGTVARGELSTDPFFDTGKVNGAVADGFPFPVTIEVINRGHERLRHLLLRMPQPHRRRQRHDPGARLSPSAIVPHRHGSHRDHRTPLRRHDQWIRRDAAVRKDDSAARPLGDRRLHPRAAAQPARRPWPTCRPTTALSSRLLRRSSATAMFGKPTTATLSRSMPADIHEQRQLPAGADQRHPRYVEARGRQAAVMQPEAIDLAA